MKTTCKSIVSLFLAAMMVLSAVSVSAARYTWESGKMPDGWTHTTKAEDVKATNILGPINPTASQEAKNLYAYLCKLTESTDMVAGQFDRLGNERMQNDYINEFGKEAAMYSCVYEGTYAQPNFVLDSQGRPTGEITNSLVTNSNVSALTSVFKKHYDMGHILLMQAYDPKSVVETILKKNKPNVYTDMRDMAKEIDATNPDRDMMAYVYWLRLQDQVIAILRDLENSGVKAYLFRNWIEFNTGGNYFSGATAEGKAAFCRVYQQTVQQFIDAKLVGWLMTYSPCMTGGSYTDNSSTIVQNPGNDYIDVYGMTAYTQKNTLGTYEGIDDLDYAWFVRTGKPMGFTEFSCRTGDYTDGGRNETRASSFTALQDIMTYWPNLSFICYWGDDHFSPLDRNNQYYGNDDGMMYVDSPYLITADELPDWRNTRIRSIGVAQLFKKADASDAYVALEERTYTAANLQALGISASEVRAFRVREGFSITFYEGDNCTGNYYGFGESLKDLSAKVSAKFRSLKVSYTNSLTSGAQVSASVDASSVGKINDSSRATVWEVNTTKADNTAATGTAWVTFDLKKEYRVNRHVLYTASASGRAITHNVYAYRVEYSTDGTTWKPMDSVRSNTRGRLDRTVDGVTGRYFRVSVTDPNRLTSGSDVNKAYIAEFELYGVDAGLATSVELRSVPVVAMGAQVRNLDIMGRTALRFGYELNASGVSFADGDPTGSGNYKRKLGKATVVIDGKEVTLVDFGAVVSLREDSAPTLGSSDVKSVSAERLYDVAADGTVKYTAVVTGIAAKQADIPIYTRAYLVYNDGGQYKIWYSNTISRSVSEVADEQLF